MPSPTSIFTSLSPNTERDDIRVARWVLFSPHRWSSHKSQAAGVEQHLARLAGQAKAVLTNSGRAAIYEALRGAALGSGDEVVIQALTCLAVPAAVTWVGAKPVYADIDAQTYNLDPADVAKKITPRTKAIIIQHTFGIPAPLTTLIPLARRHNLLIIEDLAHALGGQYDGRPLGSFGDVAIMSFGRDKIVSSVFGGAIVCSDNALMEKIEANLTINRQPPAWWTVQQLLHPLLVNALLPWYFRAHLGKAMLVAAQRLGLLSLAVSKAEKTAGSPPKFLHYSFPSALLPLLANQLAKLEQFTTHRRRIAKLYLREWPGSGYIQDKADQASWLRFPLMATDQARMLAAAKQEKIVLGDWYTTPVAPCTLDQQVVTQYVPGSCLVAEKVAQSIINLPTHPRLSEADAQQVINFIKTQV